MAKPVTPPTVDEIFKAPEPGRHPLDVLAEPDLASGVRAGYEMATDYREMLHTAFGHIAMLTATVARLTDQNRALQKSLRDVLKPPTDKRR